VVTLTADAEGRLDTDVLADAQQRLTEMDLPAGYEIRYAGKKEEEDKASAFLSKAFIVALLLIVGILVTQFNTLSAPLIIITTVVLSTIGVFAGLLICKMPFGIIMTGVGVISLAGVVVNNAIVLLDYTRQLQRRGQGVIEAAVEAGVTRLRPVLLTATTTILGLVPMATGVSFDFRNMQMAWRSETSQWWASMAIAVIFGLGFATVLTLVIVPTLYVLSYRVASFFGFGGLLKPSEKEAAAAKVWPAE
jgi:multidrug efflux pump subunit AcrB